MTDFRGNIDLWIKNSEPDYYLFFLKVWIPFNAWYVAELPHLNKKDVKIIKELQDNPNSKPRQIIENFITGNNKKAENFRAHLAELHHYLELKTIKHNGKKLSFKNLSLTSNPKKFEKAVDLGGRIYRAEFKANLYEAVIVDNAKKTIMHFRQSSYNIDDLRRHNDFIKISDRKIQNKILSCYEAIDPQKTISLVSASRSKTDYITLNSENKINFIKDPITIAQGCIKVLYSLRCMLFHGEIEPTNNNKPVFEHSFHLLKLIINELH